MFRWRPGNKELLSWQWPSCVAPKPLVIGRQVKKSALLSEREKYFTCIYRSVKKACVPNDLYNDVRASVVTNFKPKTLLLIDNCPSHININTVSNASCSALKRNVEPTTKHQKIINNIKLHYRRMILKQFRCPKQN